MSGVETSAAPRQGAFSGELRELAERFGDRPAPLGAILEATIAPLPLPFSKSLPAWTVLLLAAGALERDGLFFIAGCAAFATTAAFFALLVLGGAQAVEKLRLLLGQG